MGGVRAGDIKVAKPSINSLIRLMARSPGERALIEAMIQTQRLGKAGGLALRKRVRKAVMRRRRSGRE